ncbi:hypothetical protein [Burkholderia sp. Bp9031]|uniref:hypothetical protein n=1 Tax=Burkholderia sp. Bp9031 TaxID=2184566 RepID=UPI000F5E04FC|nr:hypothetical protein [Burkholderia sp. Bp9031]
MKDLPACHEFSFRRFIAGSAPAVPLIRLSEFARPSLWAECWRQTIFDAWIELAGRLDIVLA